MHPLSDAHLASDWNIKTPLKTQLVVGGPAVGRNMGTRAQDRKIGATDYTHSRNRPSRFGGLRKELLSLSRSLADGVQIEHIPVPNGIEPLVMDSQITMRSIVIELG
jgi:hypothetical protein